MIEDLLSLLEDEERALARGDVKTVLEMQDAKASLFSHMRDQGGWSADHLAAVRTIATRNERLLGLTMNACKQANARITAIECRISRIGYNAAGEGLSYADERAHRRY